MAKKTALFILFILMVAASFMYAQENDNISSVYPKTMAINRVYPHQLGYKVEYIKANRKIGVFYAPLEWFKKAAGYGEIVYGEGKSYPYATFYYEEGQLSHFRLYLIENFNDPSWGILRGDDYTDEFDVSELVIEYK